MLTKHFKPQLPTAALCKRADRGCTQAEAKILLLCSLSRTKNVDGNKQRYWMYILHSISLVIKKL